MDLILILPILYLIFVVAVGIAAIFVWGTGVVFAVKRIGILGIVAVIPVVGFVLGLLVLFGVFKKA